MSLPLIWFACGLQLMVASANFFAVRKFRYRENLAQATPLVREIFWVQNLYIVLILVTFAALCFAFAPELTEASVLGRCLSGFLAVFWGVRVGLQLFVFDPAVKRANARMNIVFMLAYGYLFAVFLVAAAV